MRRIFGVIGGIILGLILSQFPEYAQQYTQRLGGAVDELRIITEDFDRGASESGISREEAFARYQATHDNFLAGRGGSMEDTFSRYDQLRTTLGELETADPVKRFSLLPKYLDTEVGQRTLAAFKPGIPVTSEGFIYAGAGILIGYIVISALFAFLALPFKRRRTVYRYR
jgi:Protein of unknown function (DUF2937)